MSSDPFFALINDSKWNACIGPQGDEENYAEGYLEAAIELSKAVIDKGLLEKRDILVLPILYNARHAVELNLKLVIRQLVTAGVLGSGHAINHDIASHKEFLEQQSIPDSTIQTLLSALTPFVDSLARIDDDGQELRYHVNKNGEQSLEGTSLANLQVISQSLAALQKVLKALKERAYSICDEWPTGTQTSACSRHDLMMIAEKLPPRDSWDSEAFSNAKQEIRKQFCLSNRKFCNALNKIQESRGLSALINIESKLEHLSDSKARFLLSAWNTLHPRKPPTEPTGISFFDRDIGTIKREREQEAEVLDTIAKELSEEEFADAETVYYLARDRIFPEFYERQLERKLAEFRSNGNFQQEIHDLMSKTNFRSHFIEGLRSVGRLELAKRLAGESMALDVLLPKPASDIGSSSL